MLLLMAVSRIVQTSDGKPDTVKSLEQASDPTLNRAKKRVARICRSGPGVGR